MLGIGIAAALIAGMTLITVLCCWPNIRVWLLIRRWVRRLPEHAGERLIGDRK